AFSTSSLESLHVRAERHQATETPSPCESAAPTARRTMRPKPLRLDSSPGCLVARHRLSSQSPASIAVIVLGAWSATLVSYDIRDTR
ncbi:hypothetical protein CP533_2205, partial [Ophiocordyceps camponoti-saundersi (nom. inval.)]